jgi:hypothetical protein
VSLESVRQQAIGLKNLEEWAKKHTPKGKNVGEE